MKLVYLGIVLGLFAHLGSAQGAINLKAGLWSVSAKTDLDGKKVDPLAEMQKAFAKLPPEKRKMAEEMLAKGGLGVGSGGEQLICLSDAMLKKPQSIASAAPEARKCETTVTKMSSSKVEMEFRCADGATGKGTWKALSPNSYSSQFELKNSKGKISRIDQAGKFVSTDCGKVKPLL